MSDIFPQAPRGKKGYAPDQVEEFLERARTSYQALSNGAVLMRASDIRSAAFDLVKKGFQVTAVDEALERLERVFFEKERDARIKEDGLQEWDQFQNRRRTLVLDRVDQESRERFSRSGMAKNGYAIKEVDEFLDKIVQRFAGESALSSDDVRLVGFRAKANGYVESEVDSFLDEVIELLLDNEIELDNEIAVDATVEHSQDQQTKE